MRVRKFDLSLRSLRARIPRRRWIQLIRITLVRAYVPTASSPCVATSIWATVQSSHVAMTGSLSTFGRFVGRFMLLWGKANWTVARACR